MLKRLLFVPLLTILSVQAGKLDETALMLQLITPQNFGVVHLKHQDKQFTICAPEGDIPVDSYMVDKPLREMNKEQLAAFLQNGYIEIKECSDGKFALHGHGRLHGGGPFSAAAGYIAGKWGGQAVVIVAGYAVLLTATGAVTAIHGREAGKEFFTKVQDQSIPHLWEVSKKISHATGAVGGAIGTFVPGA